MTKIIFTMAGVYTAMICLAVAQSGSGGSTSFSSAANSVALDVSSELPAVSAWAVRQP